ncbi:MAG: glycoside hydrolase family 140 protein [Fimbriimonadales bacterium]|nr:glycoside hydrolase family 140 protein [Fimbriimonadales bacterium]
MADYPCEVHPGGRRLQTEDGKPFFWLADTAWELFHRLTREEIAEYLSVRRQQGFNVVQAVGLAELDGLRTPNREGQLPLHAEDPERPNDRYWDLVDFAFDKAEEHGITIALLPTWGDKLNKAWGDGPVVFHPRNARTFGGYLAERYGHRRNLVWILGGDRPIEAEHLPAVRAMAEGIRSAEKRRHLMSLHPPGGESSSKYVHREDWLDFNMLQSGHWWFDSRPDLMVEADLSLEPRKPVLDGEPNYENHRPFRALGELRDLNIPPFSAHQVRRATYSSVFAGGCGVTYGCHAVWQMAQPGYPGINHPLGTWRQSLHLPGARQMNHLKQLMLSMGFFEVVPDQSLIAAGLGEGTETARACRTNDGKRAAIYLPWPRPVKPRTESLAPGGRWEWFDPRSGQTTRAAEQNGFFDSPTAEDWVLLYR